MSSMGTSRTLPLSYQTKGLLVVLVWTDCAVGHQVDAVVGCRYYVFAINCAADELAVEKNTRFAGCEKQTSVRLDQPSSPDPALFFDVVIERRSRGRGAQFQARRKAHVAGTRKAHVATTAGPTCGF